MGFQRWFSIFFSLIAFADHTSSRGASTSRKGIVPDSEGDLREGLKFISSTLTRSQESNDAESHSDRRLVGTVIEEKEDATRLHFKHAKNRKRSYITEEEDNDEHDCETVCDTYRAYNAVR